MTSSTGNEGNGSDEYGTDYEEEEIYQTIDLPKEGHAISSSENSTMSLFERRRLRSSESGDTASGLPETLPLVASKEGAFLTARGTAARPTDNPEEDYYEEPGIVYCGIQERKAAANARQVVWERGAVGASHWIPFSRGETAKLEKAFEHRQPSVPLVGDRTVTFNMKSNEHWETLKHRDTKIPVRRRIDTKLPPPQKVILSCPLPGAEVEHAAALTALLTRFFSRFASRAR